MWLKTALLFLSLWVGGETIQPLPSSKILELVKGPCVFVHLWATWCPICIEELPQVIDFLNKNKTTIPVLVDLSSSFVQNNFSKKWVLSHSPQFKTYVKSTEADNAYFQALEPTVTRNLPYSALFHQGKRRQSWVGSVTVGELKRTIDSICNTK